MFPDSTDIQSFIGLATIPGRALVDTGAQHGVCGEGAYQQIEQCLAVVGLKPRIVPTAQITAIGVGGTTTFKKSAEIPLGIAGIRGILTIHTVDIEIPLLLPVELLDKLGCVLDMPENDIFWKYTGRHSKVFRIPTTPHLSIDIFEFPMEGWQCPYEQDTVIRGDYTNPTKRISRADFEKIMRLNPLLGEIKKRTFFIAPQN